MPRASLGIKNAPQRDLGGFTAKWPLHTDFRNNRGEIAASLAEAAEMNPRFDTAARAAHIGCGASRTAVAEARRPRQRTPAPAPPVSRYRSTLRRQRSVLRESSLTLPGASSGQLLTT